jgi:hypothetical protein
MMFELGGDNNSDGGIVGFGTPKPHECWTIDTDCVFALPVICSQLFSVLRPPVTTHEANADVVPMLPRLPMRNGYTLRPPPDPSISSTFNNSLLQLILEACSRYHNI